MRLFTAVLFCLAPVWLAGCSNSSTTTRTDENRVVPAGEKATAGHLSYSVIDSQILTQLGDEANPRVPKDRFILIQIAVTNSSNVDNPIPAVELVGDSGQVYNELTDGSGISGWLGLIRHVGPGQTERGYLAFDAPAAHYKIRFSDESTDVEVLADLPLSYSHEKINDSIIPVAEIPDSTGPTGSEKPKK